MSKLLLAIHSGREEELKKAFDIVCLVGEENTLIATPIDSNVKKIIKRIEIKSRLLGESVPKKIQFEDSKGDITSITFTDKR